MSNKTVIIIPARFKSSRFPGKPLVDLKGIPMVVRVANICQKVVGKSDVYVATESDKIMEVLKRYHIQGIMTSDNNLTGTDRIAEAMQNIEADIIVNVQGDEPLIIPDDIQKVIDAKIKFSNYVINAMTEFDPETNNVNIPKVVTNENNELLYMSRSLIPGSKSMTFNYTTFKQVCIYAFTKQELKDFKHFGRKSFVENLEDIEILRFFELGYKVKMIQVSGSSLAVDIPEDVKKIEEKLIPI
ncbi:MAG: 3-deoxy-manno-octulosonate cytidylyltransferase [Ignavibacteriaceae bacterium]